LRSSHGSPATAANVGYAYWSHDIGGHMPGVIEPELYMRWIQFGTFSPILRTHTTKNVDSERRIWAYPEPYGDIMRASFQLRYAMAAVPVHGARRTFDTGVAFLRPLYYDFPEAPEAYTTKNEYLFGENMLVAPVVHLLVQRPGWQPNPSGCQQATWIEWSSGKRFHGPLGLDRSYAIDQAACVPEGRLDHTHAATYALHGRAPGRPLDSLDLSLADGQTSHYIPSTKIPATQRTISETLAPRGPTSPPLSPARN